MGRTATSRACSGKTSSNARALDSVSAQIASARRCRLFVADSPTWGGFRFETSWGKQTLSTGSNSLEGLGCTNPDSGFCPSFLGIPTPEANFWDIAVFYTADWNSIKLSAAAAYTWQESAVDSGAFRSGYCDFPGARFPDGSSACLSRSGQPRREQPLPGRAPPAAYISRQVSVSTACISTRRWAAASIEAQA